MPLTNTELSYFFHLKVEQKQTQGNSAYLNRLILATKGKADASVGIYTITDKQDLKQYLEDNTEGVFLQEAQRAFEYLNELTLWVLPKDNKDLQKALTESLSIVNTIAYTLLFSSCGFSTQDLLNLDLKDFTGVIGSSIPLYKNIPEQVKAWALKPYYFVCSDAQKDGWAVSLMSYFLGANSFNNCQYLDSIQTKSQVPTPQGNWNALFEAKITHLVSSGALGLFTIGGLAAADVYIAEKTSFEIKQSWASYIKNFSPGYDDTARQKLEDAAFFVLKNFQDRGDIVNFTPPTIPSINLQNPQDKGNFTLGGFSSTVSMKSAVWKINGTIKGV